MKELHFCVLFDKLIDADNCFCSGSKHEDGTQSDSENALGEQLSSRRAFLQELCRERQGVQRTEIPFCGREDLFQHKPSSAAKKMAPVGGEVGKRAHRSSPQKANMPREQSTGSQETPNRGYIDDQSDRGTYTIELENGNAEEEEARRMIDKVDLQKLRNYVFFYT